MNEFLERVKTDRFLQFVLVLMIFGFLFLYFFFLKPLLTPEKSKLPCYNTTLVLWVPFKDYEINQYLSEFMNYCVRFEIVTKTLKEIKNDLPLALTQEKVPDIVYIDNEILTEYSNLFTYSQPVFVDSLVAYYNKDILNFLDLRPPKTIDELKTFGQKIKEYKEDFYVTGLGTSDVYRKTEIILSLMSLRENYDDKSYLRDNLKFAINLYQLFSQPESEYFVYPQKEGNDLENFAQEKLALYIGFYQDKKKILTLNPRLNYFIDVYPLNTFPPKTKIYTKIFYLASVKKKHNQVQKIFIDWFVDNQLEKMAEAFDLIPYKEGITLPYEKKVVFDSAKNYGETFDFINKDVLFENIDKILNAFSEYEKEKLINQIYYQL